MIGGLLGALIAIGILCIAAWAIIQIVAHVGVPVPAIVTTIIWAVVGIICLVLLAKGLGVAIPGF